MFSIKTIVGIAVFVVLLIFIGSFVGCERIDQGNVGLRVNLTGGDKGQAHVQDASGWQFYWKAATVIYEYPVYQLHKEMDPLEVPFKGGTVFTVHPSFNWNINPGTIKEMFQKYRVDTAGLVNGYIKNAMFIALREATNRFTVDSVLNNLTTYDATVQQELQAKLYPYFTISQFTCNLRPDESMRKTIAAKAQAIQEGLRIENEQRVIKAQAENDIISAKRDSAVRVMGALAEAKEITVKQEALAKSPQYVELVKAQRWDGHYPQYMMGSGANMLMSLPK